MMKYLVLTLYLLAGLTLTLTQRLLLLTVFKKSIICKTYEKYRKF